MKKALITGITGQDGAYLSRLLLEKGYEVHGIKRRTSLFNTARIDHLVEGDPGRSGRFVLHHGDMTDSSSLTNILQKTQPDEVYNLAAQSHVAVSFEERDVNFLVLAAVGRRYRVPLLWSLLPAGGNSATEVRFALIERYLARFAAGTVRLFIADREFIGAKWLKFLDDKGIPFAVRLLRNDSAVDGPLPGFAAKRLKDEWLIVSNRPPRCALAAYRKRWAIECLFGDAKTRGLNLEDTRLTAFRKLDLLMALVTLALAWGPGGAAHDLLGPDEPARKTHGYLAKSWFRVGFDSTLKPAQNRPGRGRPFMARSQSPSKIRGAVYCGRSHPISARVTVTPAGVEDLRRRPCCARARRSPPPRPRSRSPRRPRVPGRSGSRSGSRSANARSSACRHRGAGS